jgi:hypothetical protein
LITPGREVFLRWQKQVFLITVMIFLILNSSKAPSFDDVVVPEPGFLRLFINQSIEWNPVHPSQNMRALLSEPSMIVVSLEVTCCAYQVF